ncbi:MAG: hypothetical protein CMQ40_10720 [Gammaproteobacteria bacterium]|nr:hypothetical protein [Gammaproteobacteria bacterium]
MSGLRFPYPNFDLGERSLITIDGKPLPSRVARGVVQTLDSEARGAIERTLGGGLKYMGMPSTRERYLSNIQSNDQFPLPLLKEGDFHTIGCSACIILFGLIDEADFPRIARPGTIRYLDVDMRPIGDENGGYGDPADVHSTFYLPFLRFAVLGYSQNRDEWGNVAGSSYYLREDKPL